MSVKHFYRRLLRELPPLRTITLPASSTATITTPFTSPPPPPVSISENAAGEWPDTERIRRIESKPRPFRRLRLHVQIREMIASSSSSSNVNIIATVIGNDGSSSSSSTSTSTRIATDIRHLQHLTTYLRNQNTYVELLERYNPGLRGDDGEDRIRMTARMVGLEVPK